jgi:hypothetical protein
MAGSDLFSWCEWTIGTQTKESQSEKIDPDYKGKKSGAPGVHKITRPFFFEKKITRP